MWEITLSGQVFATLWSIPVGAGLCLIYDMIRVLRQRLRPRLVVGIISDILFFVVAAFITFCVFLIFTAGQIRFYVFIGELAGFLLCRFTFSRVFVRFFALLVRLMSRLIYLMARVLGQILCFFEKIFGKIANFTRNIAKKVLQPIRGMLYNLKVKKLPDAPDTAPADK